jgi:hypothetical protein
MLNSYERTTSQNAFTTRAPPQLESKSALAVWLSRVRSVGCRPSSWASERLGGGPKGKTSGLRPEPRALAPVEGGSAVRGSTAARSSRGMPHHPAGRKANRAPCTPPAGAAGCARPSDGGAPPRPSYERERPTTTTRVQVGSVGLGCDPG